MEEHDESTRAKAADHRVVAERVKIMPSEVSTRPAQSRASRSNEGIVYELRVANSDRRVATPERPKAQKKGRETVDDD